MRSRPTPRVTTTPLATPKLTNRWRRVLRRGAAGLLAASVLLLAVPSHAGGSVASNGGCVDGGGVSWRSEARWGSPYLSADGITRVQLTYAGWTTTRSGVVPTDSAVRTYDGSGKLLQTLSRTAAFDYGSGAAYDARNPLDPPYAPGRSHVTVSTGVDGDGYAGCTVRFIQPNLSSPDDPVVAAAGDIACAVGGTVGASCQHKAVSDRLVADTAVGTVLVLGDNQYQDGSLSDYDAAYAPTWGRLKPKTYPVPGNHDYLTSGAAGYYDYFGARAGDRSRGYYSFDIGVWHFVALNSEKDTGASGAQVAWLKADLLAHQNACTAAFYHRPRFSSGAEHGDSTSVAPFFQTLYDANVDLILNGHDHDYERFFPLNASGARDNARGITEIVTGLGGRSHYAVTPRAITAASNQTSYGYSRLVLHDGSADITFVAGVGSYTDSTRLTCH